MSAKGIPTREMRPLRRVLDADGSGDTPGHTLECGHFEPMRATTDARANMRRCSQCAPMLPVEEMPRAPDPMALVKRRGRHGR